MALFGGRASMLEVQNRALIKIAGERAQRISELERELQQAVQTVERLQAEVKRLEADAERLKLEREAEVQRLKGDVGRLKLEREFYHKRAVALEQDVRVVSEAAAKYSLWGQTLVCELGKLDPAGQREREFGIWSETLKGR
jgi:FtsZ-binding cell division protein ZapB